MLCYLLSKRSLYLFVLFAGHNGLVAVSYFHNTSSFISDYNRLHTLQEQEKRL